MNIKLGKALTLNPPPALRARAMGSYLFPPPVSDARALRPGGDLRFESEGREVEGQILVTLGIAYRKFQISDLRFAALERFGVDRAGEIAFHVV